MLFVRRALRALGLAGVVFGLAAIFGLACESPEAFHLERTPGLTGAGGEWTGIPDGGPDLSGSGGLVLGTGGHGTGGHGTGGAIGSGGATASGGKGGAGGAIVSSSGGAGGRGVSTGAGGAIGGRGGPGTGGTITTGTGGAAKGGAGGSAAGGRGMTSTGGVGGGPGPSGGVSGGGGRGAGGATASNCVAAVQAGPYSYTPAQPCSACADHGTSRETQCKAGIDCLATKWSSCDSNCKLGCLNSAGDSVIQTCVKGLVNASCGAGSL